MKTKPILTQNKPKQSQFYRVVASGEDGSNPIYRGVASGEDGFNPIYRGVASGEDGFNRRTICLQIKSLHLWQPQEIIRTEYQLRISENQ